MKLQLPSGTTGFRNDAGQWVCTGSQMGRRDIIPDDKQADIKLSIQRLDFVDGDYDKWGAYWGSGQSIYCAFKYTPSCVSIMLNFDCLMFVRANNRHHAKQLIRQELPQARFYH